MYGIIIEHYKTKGEFPQHLLVNICNSGKSIEGDVEDLIKYITTSYKIKYEPISKNFHIIHGDLADLYRVLDSLRKCDWLKCAVSKFKVFKIEDFSSMSWMLV